LVKSGDFVTGMERFTTKARRVLSFAHHEAERTRNNSIGTEHLLLGLLDEEGSVASHVLHEIGMISDRVREIVELVTNASRNFDPNRIELASETQQALEYAVEEARRLNHNYVATEHILLGLVRVDGNAMEVFRRLDVTVDHIRRQTRRVINESALSSSNTSSYESISSKKTNQVLLVYAHDIKATVNVAHYVENLGLQVVPFNESSDSDSKNFAAEVVFVVVLLTPDDLGAPRSDAQNTKFRASQKVIYELGFFHGKLGHNRVCVLFKNDPETDMELPSESLGIVYIPLDSNGKWKLRLAKQMQEVGIIINSENI